MTKSNESLKQSEQKMLERLERARLSAPEDYRHLHVATLPRAQASLAYFEFGDPKGKPLLCLHGLSMTGLAFAPWHDYFTRLGVRAIAPCLLGGVYDPDPHTTIDDRAACLVELLERLDIAQCDLVGFSWGTLPALALLARAPQQIRRAGLVGAMVPLDFAGPDVAGQLKADVRTSLAMVARMPALHRALMWLVCKMPLAKLIEQFKDEHLSAAEQAALVPGTPFYQSLARAMRECLRTGSGFFTLGWRMFLDKPAYALAELAAARDVRLYVAENDNVHLPYFSALIAAACAGVEAEAVMRSLSAPAFGSPGAFNLAYVQDRTSVWKLDGAGRMACMVHLQDALDNLLLTETQVVVAA